MAPCLRALLLTMFYEKESAYDDRKYPGLGRLATQLLNAEAEIETIQDLLGHNWITTTQKYCKVSNLKVQRDYFKAMRQVQQCSVQPDFNSILDAMEG